MNRKISKLFMLALITLLVVMLASCGKDDETDEENPVALVIIAGNHANARMPLSSGDSEVLTEIKELIGKSVVIERKSGKYKASANVSIVISDGNPEMVELSSEEAEIFKCEANNRANLQTRIEKMEDNIAEFLMNETLRADDEEVDLLAAIIQAKSKLNQYDGCDKYIYILDTGITTTGLLDMRNIPIFDDDNSPESIFEQVKSGVPNLDGIQVKFWGLGNVASPQENISNNYDYQQKLSNLWTYILKTAGAEVEEFYCIPNEGVEMLYSEDGDLYPYVSTIPIPKEPVATPVADPVTIKPQKEGVTPTPTPVPEPPTLEPVTLTSQDLGFLPNSAEYRNGKNQAIICINNIKDDLEKYLNNQGVKLYIVGSVAKTDKNKELESSKVSEARANAVRDLLVSEFGIPGDRIVTIDAGTHRFTWRSADEWEGGDWNPGNAEKNRIVRIIGENSKDYEELKRDKYI